MVEPAGAGLVQQLSGSRVRNILAFMDSQPDLNNLFAELNERHFKGVLSPPVLRWNSRLRASCGRFIPGKRNALYWRQSPPVIEIATYLLEEENSLNHVTDTLGHEMIHYWLWSRRKRYGHGSEFVEKMREMGVSRYNPVPRRRPYNHVYRCPSCGKDFPARRKLGNLACLSCCRRFSGGRYDRQFRLYLLSSV